MMMRLSFAMALLVLFAVAATTAVPVANKADPYVSMTQQQGVPVYKVKEDNLAAVYKAIDEMNKGHMPNITVPSDIVKYKAFLASKKYSTNTTDKLHGSATNRKMSLQAYYPHIYDMFARFDKDHTGQLNYAEFRDFMAYLHLGYKTFPESAKTTYKVQFDTLRPINDDVYIVIYGETGRVTGEHLLGSSFKQGENKLVVTAKDVLIPSRIRIRLKTALTNATAWAVSRVSVEAHGKVSTTRNGPNKIVHQLQLRMYPGTVGLHATAAQVSEGSAMPFDAWTKHHFNVYKNKVADFQVWLANHLNQQRVHNARAWYKKHPTAKVGAWANLGIPIAVEKANKHKAEVAVKATKELAVKENARKAAKKTEMGVKHHAKVMAAKEKLAKANKALLLKQAEAKAKSVEKTHKQQIIAAQKAEEKKSKAAAIAAIAAKKAAAEKASKAVLERAAKAKQAIIDAKKLALQHGEEDRKKHKLGKLNAQQELLNTMMEEAKKHSQGKKERANKVRKQVTASANDNSGTAPLPTLKQRAAAVNATFAPTAHVKNATVNFKAAIKAFKKEQVQAYLSKVDPTRFGIKQPGLVPTSHVANNDAQHMLDEHLPGMSWGGGKPVGRN